MKRRIAHIIKDNKSTQLPTRIIYFDTETREVPMKGKEIELVLNLGVAAHVHRREGGGKDSVTWLNFTTSTELWDFILSKTHDRTRLYLVAHNVQFDFKVVGGFARLKDAGWTLKKLIVNGTSNIWDFKCGTRSITVLDNMNYFKSSLADLGSSIGIPKMTMPQPDAPIEEWFTYCRRDVEVMIEAWRLWLKFIRENDLGTFGKTLASQAMNAYRHRFMPHKIYIHDWQRVVDLERASYHGGRTECFHIGRLPSASYHILDVNSMYPGVMQANDYPCKVTGLIEKMKVQDLARLVLNQCCTARVTLNTDEPVYAVLKDGRLIFPTGKFSTTLTTREIIYAIEREHIKIVHQVATYDKARLFADYVGFFYNERLKYKAEHNDAFSYMCKLLLNSLYGKFGQRNLAFEKVEENPDAEDGIEEYYDLDTKAWVTRRTISGIVEQSVGMKEGFNSLVAIASHITADARLRLWEYITKVGRANVYYCDTDSIFTNDDGLRRASSVLDPSAVGMLSIKGHSDALEIFGPKDYLFGGTRTLKGIRANAEIVRPGTWRQTRFEGFAGALRKGRLDRMVISSVDKTLKRKYLKGNVTSTGSVDPFVLSDI